MRQLARAFLRDERGATSIEYGLIAAGIGVAVISLVTQVGDELRIMFLQLKDSLASFNAQPRP